MNDLFDTSQPMPLPPPSHVLDQRVKIASWPSVWQSLHDEKDRSVLGWVKIQTKVSESKRLRPWEIAQRLDVSSDLLDVRYEPSFRGSTYWTEDEGNETHSERTRRKLRSQKKQLAEKWGWDTWARWTPPPNLSAEQVRKVEAVKTQREVSAAYNAERYDEVIAPMKAEGEKIRSLDEGAREIYYLERDIPDLPKPIREREEERLRQLRAVRTIAYRKNQRYGMDGWREWRISVLRETMERNKAKFGKKEEK